jgi:hypothetical protein
VRGTGCPRSLRKTWPRCSSYEEALSLLSKERSEHPPKPWLRNDEDPVGTSNPPDERNGPRDFSHPGGFPTVLRLPLARPRPVLVRMVLRQVVTLRVARCPCYRCWARR